MAPLYARERCHGMHDTDALIARLPKCELHIHVEGSLEPELMFTLARRNGIRLPYASVEAVRQAYRFRNLQDFLDIYYQGMSVLITEQDFYDLAWAYLERAHADNVRHVEMFFDPQGHTSRGIPFATVIEGLSRAIADAGRTLGIKASLIMCFLRHLDEADAERTLDSALLVARIDHGVRSIEDEPLVDRLARERIPLTVCPLSNVRLRVVDDLAHHPLRRMMDKGLMVTVNSDDPAYFGGYVKENYRASAQALGLGRDEVAALVRNGINASLMAEPDKATLLAEVARVLAGTM